MPPSNSSANSPIKNPSICSPRKPCASSWTPTCRAPRSTLALLARLGNTSEHASDIGMGHAPDSRIAARARSTGAALLTRDLDFADIRHYPPRDYQGILVLRMPDDTVAQTIVNLLERFLKQTELTAQIPGHLVILEPGRVRFRPSLR